jgi:hypothetical protein
MVVKQLTILVSFLIGSSGFGVAAQAYTRAEFAGFYGIIRVLTKDPSGATNPDARTLFEAMDVPVQDSMMGPGKVIQSTGQGLQFICADRGGDAGVECSIFIQPSTLSKINPLSGVMEYKVSGAAADSFTKLFKLDGKGEFNFASSEGSLRVGVKAQSFEVSFHRGSSQNLTSAGKTLVLVAVEDTLKVSHSQNFWDSLNYNQNADIRFLGMNEVLKLMVKKNPGLTLVYLTQPPELEVGRVQLEFLKKNDYPPGQLVNYGNHVAVSERLPVLRDLIKANKPDTLVLLGHNGGTDVDVYFQLAREFSAAAGVSAGASAVVKPYLHVVYSTNSENEVGKALQPGQTGFVTAVELLVDMQKNQLVDDAETKTLAQALLPRILSEQATSGLPEVAIPSFVDCDNFLWNWELPVGFEFVEPLKQYLSNRCYH